MMLLFGEVVGCFSGKVLKQLRGLAATIRVLFRVVFFSEASSFRGEKQAGMHGGQGDLKKKTTNETKLSKDVFFHVTWKCKHCFN